MCTNFNEKIIDILELYPYEQTKHEIKSIDRSLDIKKCEEYISLFDEGIYKEFAQLVIDTTTYINHEMFLADMDYSYGKFLKNVDANESFLLFFGAEKFGSENWVLNIMWEKIRNSIIVDGIFTDIFDDNVGEGIYDDKNLVIFDDCSYSGANLCSLIDGVQYHTKSKNIKFHLIVPYISHFAATQLINISNCEIYLYNRYEPVFLTDTLPKNLEEDEANIIDFFDLENIGTPMYLDHKLANNFATFPGIYKNGYYMKNGEKYEYGTILKELPSRKPVEIIEKYFFEAMIEYKYTKEYFDKLNDMCKGLYRTARIYSYTHDDFLRDSAKYLHIIKTLPKGESAIKDISEIIPGKLYLGGEINFNDGTYEKLRNLGITRILDIKNEYKDKTNELNSKHIFILDEPPERIDVHFANAIRYIDQGKKVYVHCLLGVSRSASIVIAYVAFKLKMNFVDAYNYVYERRNCIEPNLSFKLQLASYIGQ